MQPKSERGLCLEKPSPPEYALYLYSQILYSYNVSREPSVFVAKIRYQ